MEPAELRRRVDLRADRDAGPARGRVRLGLDAPRRDRVALVYFGDGATSEGAFHEGANLAAVMKAPLVLFCNNNQWAISTPLAEQTRGRRARRQGGGYGIPGERVDGTRRSRRPRGDARAASAARAGDGPTFIEAVTYRAAPHATADDPSAYIDLDRVEEARRSECLARFEAYLRRRGLLDDALVRDRFETTRSS